MQARLRFSLLNSFLLLTSIALAVGWWATVKPPAPMYPTDRPPNGGAIEVSPLTISMAEDHGLNLGWYFSLNSAGRGELTIAGVPDDIKRSVDVSSEQLNELRQLLIKEDFFELQDDYGELVPDGGTQTLTISVGEWTKTVRIHFLGNWVADHDIARLREPARALRVWILVRTWFKHPKAADSRIYDQRVIDSVRPPQESSD